MHLGRLMKINPLNMPSKHLDSLVMCAKCNKITDIFLLCMYSKE